MDNLSHLAIRTSLALTDEIAVGGKGRDSRLEKITLSTLSGLIGAAGSNNNILGVVDDPNTVHTPSDVNSFSIYAKDQAVPPVVWIWSVARQNWFVILS